MKSYTKWRNWMFALVLLIVAMCAYALWIHDWIAAICIVVITGAFTVIFISFWHALKKRGLQTEFDISRVLGRDAKEALQVGDVGILTYNDEFVVTWTSDFFRERHIDLVNRKITAWIENVRELFDEDIDSVIGKYDHRIYEILKKEDAQVLYVRDITEVYKLRHHQQQNEVVAALMQLDNYVEYQSYENEEVIANINITLAWLVRNVEPWADALIIMNWALGLPWHS